MEMNTIQRLTDARHCIEGKIVAVVLSVLMALSFLNVSVFVDVALADDSFDNDIKEKTMEQTAEDDVTRQPAAESAGVAADVESGSSTAAPSIDTPQTDAGTTLTTTADGVDVELEASSVLPEGARLLVGVAETDQAKAAASNGLAVGEVLFRIYQISLVDEAGTELNPLGVTYRVTVNWKSMIASSMQVYRINSAEGASLVAVEKPLTSQGEVNPNALTFTTTALNAPFAFAVPESTEDENEAGSFDTADSNQASSETGEGGNVVLDENENASSGNTDNTDDANNANNESDASGVEGVAEGEVAEPGEKANGTALSDAPESEDAVAQQITLYVGETRDLSRFVAAGGTWSSENTTVATVSVNGSVKALVAGSTIVRCGEVTFAVTVKPAPESDIDSAELAYFYFLPPSENASDEGAASSVVVDTSKAQFLGSGLVQMPYGYERGTTLVNGSVIPESKDTNGNAVKNKVVNLDDLVVSSPSDFDVSLGLRAYYNGSLDENRSKIKFEDITGYSYDVVCIADKATCTDYNGELLAPSSAMRVYVQMRIKTADQFTVTYKVASPTGLLTHAVLHKVADPAIELGSYDPDGEAAASIVVDGATYSGIQHASENGIDYHFDGWYLDGRYRQRADATYDGKDSTTFYARYLSRDAQTVTFDTNGGAFADGSSFKTIRADEGGVYWLPEAPERFGYEFDRWVSSETGSRFEAGTDLVMGDADVNYTASWKAASASIVLDACDGAFSDGAPLIILEGVTAGQVNHAEASTPVLAGYKFVGWNTAADGTGETLTTLPSTFAGGTMTLYAQYEEDPSQYYTVTYRTTNSGVLSQPDSLVADGTELYDRNLIGSHAEGIKGATAQSLFPNYYTFAGWFKLTPSEDGRVELMKLVSTEQTLTPEIVAQNLNWVDGKCVDTTFYARFDYNSTASTDTAPYVIEYYVMDDQGAYPQVPTRSYASILQNVSVGENYEIPEVYIGKGDNGYDFSFLEPGFPDSFPGVEPIEGFVADRYVLDEDRTTMSASYSGADVLTFKVYLAKRLGVRFEAGDHGELSSKSVEGAKGAASASSDAIEYHLLKGTAFPKVPDVNPDDGYQFAGWKVGAEDAKDYFDRVIDRALMVTAHYDALEATIAFESNGGSKVASLVGETDGAVDAMLPTPVREGYTFAGWYSNEKLNGEPLSALPSVFPAGTTTYYAKWTANDAYIVFDKNASDATGPQTGVQGETDGSVPSVSFPDGSNFQREGYLFAGWNTKADGTGDIVTAFPATFAAGTTTYYAQWKLDVRGLDAASFSFQGTYNGRERGIAMPSALKMKDGETLTLLAADGSPIENSQRFAKDVADTAENLTVVICDAKGKELSRITGVSVVIEPATLTVTTSSLIYPFDGNTATSAGIAVTGLQNGETIGYRATGAASQVGDEVENGFELTWADSTNGYTAKEANYTVAADLGTIRVVSSACPVKVEGYVGVYDGAEHSISYEVAAEEAEKATISFDGPTAYTNAGNRTINYTVKCADHGILSGSIDMKILPRPVTIAVEDSYKIASTADPEFTGAIVEGHLVQPSDLGAISFVRTNDTEEVGFYPEVLTANYLRNTNYDVQVVPGTFTIGPAGSTVVPPRNPLLPPRSSLGAGMPAGATTPADAIAGVVTTMVGSQRAAAVAEQFGAVAGIILDEDVPMAASVSFDSEEPTVTRVGGEVIEDDATALGAFDEPHCWVHWVMLIGVLLTVGYAAVVVANRLGYARRIDDFNNSLTSTVATETEDTRAARVAHKA